MIYTVTFNPAIDYVIHTDRLKTGQVNRSNSEEIYIGGKGINVSIVLKELEIKSVALGFVAGFTGEAIENDLKKRNIYTDFIHLENGFSRINVKIKAEDESEINGQGPIITESDLELLFTKLQLLNDGDTLVLAGSIPKTLSSDVYEQIISAVSDKKIKVIVDASGELLMNVLKYKPFLVKPNNFELGEMFDIELNSIKEIEIYARRLKAMGAKNVLVSMAQDGAMLIDENDKCHICGVCKGTVKNSVGAGDSMVAGFIAGIENNDYDYALKLGTAAGGATAFSDGLAEKELIYELMKQLG